MKVGVLALQGDFREHIAAAENCGHSAIPVRRESELAEIDCLILPGGESTTIVHLAQTFGIYEPIKKRIAQGLPVYGSCAGMILLAEKVIDGTPNQRTFGGLEITVRRNAFGRQVESFESELDFLGKKINAVFIRAPWVEEHSKQVTVLATAAGHPVAVQQGKVLATSFHPELTDELSVHRYFFDEICKAG